ncbi:MAG TPA: hypothetical protein VGY55_05035 [Pirellulales bacterium]|nr:hypothetical protein [Pirellulales bacterium]
MPRFSARDLLFTATVSLAGSSTVPQRDLHVEQASDALSLCGALRRFSRLCLVRNFSDRFTTNCD